MPKNFGELSVEAHTAAGVKGIYGVVGVSLNGLPGALKQLVWIFALIFSVILPAHAQQMYELQKELQPLKQRYEQTTLELQS